MKSRILVVDDDLSILELLRILLESEDYQVQTFDSGPTALRNALAHPPDAAIIDLMMPGMNGLDLINALRFNVRTRQLPILICSAYYGDLRHITADLQDDNTLCLRKPFQIQELLDLVAHMVSTSKQNRRRRKKGLEHEVLTPIAAASGGWPPQTPPGELPRRASLQGNGKAEEVAGGSDLAPLPPVQQLAAHSRRKARLKGSQAGNGRA